MTHDGIRVVGVAFAVLVANTDAHAETASLDDALAAYVQLARSSYELALAETESMAERIGRFLESPTATGLDAARESWTRARWAYGPTEVFRFFGGPVDGVHPVHGGHGPEGRINAWPVDEAYLDYVRGRTNGGLMQTLDLPISRETLEECHGSIDETQVTLGYHSIEFLLWGQDFNTEGPGDRSFEDYLPGDPVRERRRECLQLLCRILLDDLRYCAVEWRTEEFRYGEYFLGLSAEQALSRALSGVATLAGFELAAERLGVPLASGEQEDEHSCFSDTTHLDLLANIAGLRLALLGGADGQTLLDACAAEGAGWTERIRRRLEVIEDLCATLPFPIDQVLIAPHDDPRRQHLQALAGELIGLAGEVRGLGQAHGVRVVIGG